MKPARTGHDQVQILRQLLAQEKCARKTRLTK